MLTIFIDQNGYSADRISRLHTQRSGVIQWFNHGNLTERTLKKKRYWGLAALATLWVIISIVAGAAVGQTGTSVVTAAWFLVAIYAVTGNISGIFKTAKFVLILQAAVGSVVFFWLLSDTSAQRTLGNPTEFAIGVGISILAWSILYLWSKDKNSIHKDENMLSKKYLPPQIVNLQTQKTEATTASASRPISHFENPNLSRFNDSSSIDTSHSDTEIFTDIPYSNDQKTTNNRKPTSCYQQIPNEKQQEEIEILLEHDDAVRTMVEEVSGLPFEVKQGVLLEVLNNPDKNIIELRNAMILRALGRPDMEWNNDLELVVSRLKTADPENVIQFFKVFPVLSRRMSVHEIRSKVISIPESTFYVESAGGRIIKVTQRGDDVFEFISFISGNVTLHSLEEVFDYLGTPKKRRQKSKSW